MFAGGLFLRVDFHGKDVAGAPGPKAPRRQRPMRNGMTLLYLTLFHSVGSFGSCTVNAGPP